MKRTWLNFVVDGVTALCAIGIVWTGLLMYFVLPPGSGRGATLLGMDRHEWGGWHLYLALGGLALVLVHVMLHWQWVCVMACRCVPGWRKDQPRRSRRIVAGIAVVLIVAGGLLSTLWWASANVDQSTATQQRGEGHGYHGGRG